MRHYELMVILDPDLEERTVAPSLDKFLNVVRKGGGTVENVDIWGRRRLAYEIAKKTEGIYAVVDVNADAGGGAGARPSAQPQRGRAADQGDPARRRSRPPRARRRSAPGVAGDTIITIIGNLTDDPELRFTPSRRRGRELHRRLHPADVRPPVQRVEGRRDAVHALLRVARTPPRTSPSRCSAAPGSSSPGG